MAIADRISAMYDHIGEIYDTLELGGDTTQNKNIVNINAEIKREYKDFLKNGIDELWNKWEKVEGEGETLTLNNTMEGKMKVDLKGNTYQYTTTGKNLVNDDFITGYQIQTQGQIYENQYWNANANFFKVQPNTQYSFVALNTGHDNQQQLCVAEYSSNTESSFIIRNQQLINTNYLTITTSATTQYVRVAYNNGYGVGNYMLVLGNAIPTTYEPYTGGQPSPSPSYPQQVQVVSGDNTIKVEGKNLFDKDNANIINGYFDEEHNIITSNINARIIYIPCQPNTTYTISKLRNQQFNVACTEILPNIDVSIGNTNLTGTTGVYNGSTRVSLTYTTNSTAKYLLVRYTYETQVSSEIMLPSIQIEVGSATTYQPYQSASYPVNLGNIELCKIGTYQDRIYKDNGKWYLNKQIGKVILDGSETGAGGWALYNHVFYLAQINDYKDSDNIPYCNYYKGVVNVQGTANMVNKTVAFNFNHTDLPRLFIRDDDIASIEDFKTWLSTHNTEVYYVLATPTYEEITDTTLLGQLNALENANSYNNTTNVSQSNDDLASILDVTALEDIS